jgi:hypothetical protein
MWQKRSFVYIYEIYKEKEQLIGKQSADLLTKSLPDLSSHIPHMVFRMMGLKCLELHHLQGAGTSHVLSELNLVDHDALREVHAVFESKQTLSITYKQYWRRIFHTRIYVWFWRRLIWPI